MSNPTPYGKPGRPPISDDETPDLSKNRSIRLPESFYRYFCSIAKEEGLSFHAAARMALEEWAKHRKN